MPANGWSVIPSGAEPERAPVRLAVLDDGLSADGVVIRLLDEPDVGDLYNFCYAEPGQRPEPPSKIELSGEEIDARWDGLRILARIWRRPDDSARPVHGRITITR